MSGAGSVSGAGIPAPLIEWPIDGTMLGRQTDAAFHLDSELILLFVGGKKKPQRLGWIKIPFIFTSVGEGGFLTMDPHLLTEHE